MRCGCHRLHDKRSPRTGDRLSAADSAEEKKQSATAAAVSSAATSACTTHASTAASTAMQITIRKTVAENIRFHDPASPFLIGGFREGDIIKEAKQESYFDAQLRLF